MLSILDRRIAIAEQYMREPNQCVDGVWVFDKRALEKASSFRPFLA